ncbi:MAG: hypothetical protein IH984_00125 [Planctomycetes bacterium]|nr:hypothetical protein [Planctomycetota bacterium]
MHSHTDTTNHISGLDLLAGLKATLADKRVGIDYEEVVAEFGQVPASEERLRGKKFHIRDHVRGLVLAQLSSQRPWGPIAENMAKIDRLFHKWDPDKLLEISATELVDGVRGIHCGNRLIAKQMNSLVPNIKTLRRIEVEFGSLDSFIESKPPDAIANQLANPGRFKLKQIGFTLAMEYLRNVGIRAGKPDVHVRRVLGGERLAFLEGEPSEQQAVEMIGRLASEAKCNPTYLDNLLWMFCAQDYGNVCKAQPRCEICSFREKCKWPALH